MEGQTVVGLGPRDAAGAHSSGGRHVNLVDTIILPSLVNAHTHLELSGYRDAVPPAQSMSAWARGLMASVAQAGVDERDVQTAVAALGAAGTGLVGDVTNTLVSVLPLAESAVDAVVFKELLGFNEPSPAELVARELATVADLGGGLPPLAGRAPLRIGVSAHAPYSVSPALFRAIAAADQQVPLCVHLAESLEELQFLRSGSGPWRAVLEERGRWDAGWRTCDDGPVAYLEQLGWLTARTVVVHGVHLTAPELRRLATVGVTLVTCPRSNRWTGAGIPPVERFYASGIQVALGTDSLASVPDLNLFADLAELRRLAPTVPAAALLRSATRIGAAALGYVDRGAIEPGLRASLITVDCARTVDDVEEYLVGGIEPEQVQWLDAR